MALDHSAARVKVELNLVLNEISSNTAPAKIGRLAGIKRLMSLGSNGMARRYSPAAGSRWRSELRRNCRRKFLSNGPLLARYSRIPQTALPSTLRVRPNPVNYPNG
jgi:hypothetical protein